MGTKQRIHGALFALLLASPQASAEDDLALPERSEGAGGARVPFVKPSTGGTIGLKPNGVASPPPNPGATTTSRHRSPGGPARARWHYLPTPPTRQEETANPAGTAAASPAAAPITSIVLIPGVHSAGVREGSTRAFARAMPVPKGFKGIRDLGTGTPEDVARQFKKFLGRPGDPATISKLVETAVFLYGAAGHPIKAVHIHDPADGDGDGVLRMVVVGPAIFAAR